MLIRTILAVAAGSAVGGLLRYLCQLLLPTAVGQCPWGTLLANVAGCFVLGVLTAWCAKHAPHPLLQPFLGVGLCGGFTTLSTFVNEQWSLHQQQLSWLAIGYLLLTLLLAFLSLAVGHRLGACL